MCYPTSEWVHLRPPFSASPSAPDTEPASLRVGHVVREGGDAASIERRRDVEAVDHHAPLVGAASIRRKERHERRRLRPHVAQAHHQSRNGRQEGAIGARGWKRIDDLAAEHRLPSGRLRVDDWRLAAT
jgi:hypothetical protein